MKITKSTAVILAASLLFAVFAVGIFAGRQASRRVIYADEILQSPQIEKTEVKVNVNTASVRELAALDGISTALAERIVESREQWGRFDSLERLLQIDGFTKRILDSLQDVLTVEDA